MTTIHDIAPRLSAALRAEREEAITPTYASFARSLGITLEVEFEGFERETTLINGRSFTDNRQNFSLTLTRPDGRTMLSPWKQGSGVHDDPDIEGVLDCFASDESIMLDCKDALDFMVQFCYEDTDEARKTWEALTGQHDRLTAFLSADEIDTLIYKIERL